MNRLLPTICLLCGLSLPAAGQVYKWKDENGVTHYGERPSQSRKAEKLEPQRDNPAPAPSAGASWQEKELAFQKRRIETEQAETQAKDKETAQTQACHQARDQLAQMKAASRLYQLNERGERVFASDAERETSIAQLEQQIAAKCR